MMADLPGYLRNCLHTGKLAVLAILVSGGIVLQILVSNTISLLINCLYIVCLEIHSTSLFRFLVYDVRHVLCTITGGQC